MNISIAVPGDDGLSQVVWSFWMDGSRFLLDTYREERRVSKRHKWVAEKAWCRLTFGFPFGAVTMAKPAVTADIKERLIAEFAERVRTQKEW